MPQFSDAPLLIALVTLDVFLILGATKAYIDKWR